MTDMTMEVPLVQLDDGRPFLPDRAVAEEPILLEFVGRFSNYWQRDELRCGWVGQTALNEQG